VRSGGSITSDGISTRLENASQVCPKEGRAVRELELEMTSVVPKKSAEGTNTPVTHEDKF